MLLGKHASGGGALLNDFVDDGGARSGLLTGLHALRLFPAIVGKARRAHPADLGQTSVKKAAAALEMPPEAVKALQRRALDPPRQRLVPEAVRQ
ncbi:MAG: hypothetical protein LC808_09255 [Actinobacteria bacterium]|nr:hypothetical protein [Actinomycetota bacterium]